MPFYLEFAELRLAQHSSQQLQHHFPTKSSTLHLPELECSSHQDSKRLSFHMVAGEEKYYHWGSNIQTNIYHCMQHRSILMYLQTVLPRRGGEDHSHTSSLLGRYTEQFWNYTVPLRLCNIPHYISENVEFNGVSFLLTGCEYMQQ